LAKQLDSYLNVLPGFSPGFSQFACSAFSSQVAQYFCGLVAKICWPLFMLNVCNICRLTLHVARSTLHLAEVAVYEYYAYAPCGLLVMMPFATERARETERKLLIIEVPIM